MITKHVSFITLILALTTDLSFAQDKHIAQATENFNNSCVRALPSPALLADKVQQHHFHLESSKGEFAIPFGLESAQLGQQQSIQLKNSGCEYYTFDIRLILNAEKIERNHQLCQTCLVSELKNLATYFHQDDRGFYLDGIQTLEQQLGQRRAFKVGHSYQLKDTEEMPHVLLFNKIEKQRNGQYWIEFTNSVGPL